MKEYANLDVLRAFAVLAVFCGHLALQSGVRSDKVVNLAHLGVVFFFVHTSLVLMFSLERLAADSDKALTARFYIRRGFRVYPLSVLIVLSLFLFEASHYPVHRAFWKDPVGNLISNLLLIQNLTGAPSLPSPLWSLPYEVQMYLVLPVLFIAVRGSRILTLSLAYVIGLVLASRFEIAQYVPCFLAGIVAYTIWRSCWPKINGLVWPALICCVAAAYVVYKSQMHSDWIAASVVGLTVPFFRQISWRPMVVSAKLLARYSYGIYLCHFPLISLVFERHWSRALKLAVSVMLTAAIPVVVYHALEAPMIRQGVRLAKQIRIRGFSLRGERLHSRGEPQSSRS